MTRNTHAQNSTFASSYTQLYASAWKRAVFAFSLVDLFRNLIPDNQPIPLVDGTITYNDGYMISKLIKFRKFPNEYAEAFDLYDKKEYVKSIRYFDDFLNLNIKDENLYRLNISANMQLKNFERAKILFDTYHENYKLTSDDYSNGGLIYSRLFLLEESLTFYDQSLKLNPNNCYSLNNKGFTLNTLERYSEAIPLFDKAIAVDEHFAYSYNNRGLSKIKTGKIEEGLLDIEKSMQLDQNNSYAYRNLGIYHFDKGEITKARELFLKSKELDQETYLIDELILSSERGNLTNS